MMKRRIWMILVVMGVSLSACSAGTPAASEVILGGSISGATLQESAAGERMDFGVEVAQAGEPIGIDARGAVVSGALRVQLVDEAGNVAFAETFDTPGPFALTTVVKPEFAGMYRFGVAWDGPVQASYNLLWQPGEIAVPEVKPWALFGGIGMVLVALGYTAYALMRKLGWAYLGWGALAWVVTVVVKFAMAIPLNPVIYQSLTGMLPESAALPIFNIYVGLLTGLTEVLITWLVLKNTRLGRVSWSKALAFGIGFGAVEALLLGVSSLANVVLGMTAPDMAPLQALEQIARLNSLWVGAAPVVERFFTVLIHILANVLLFYGVARSDARWFWASFVYKSLVDVVAAFGQSWGIETLAKLWLIEAFVILLGVVAWWGIQQVKQRYPGPAV